MSPDAPACRWRRRSAVEEVVELGEGSCSSLGRGERDRLDLARLEVLVLDARVLSRRTVTSSQRLRVQRGAAAEPAVVDHLQQRGERLGVAVVRGGGEEEPVLAPLGQRPRRDRALAVDGVAAAARRRRSGSTGATWWASSTTSTSKAKRRAELRRRRSRRRRAAVAGRAASGSHAMLTMTRGKSRNGLACEAVAAAHLAPCSSLLTMTNSRPNFSRISSCHFSARLGGQTMTDRAGPVAEQQLLDHQAGLDRLAEADVVGEQQVRARRLQCPAQRLELVGLDVGAAAEWRLVGVRVRGGDRAPAHRVDERAEDVRVVERLGGDGLGQALVGATVWPTSSSQTTVSSSPSRSSSSDCRVTTW